MNMFNQEGQTVGVQVNIEEDSSKNISLTKQEIRLIEDGLYCSIWEARGDDDSSVLRIKELLEKLEGL